MNKAIASFFKFFLAVLLMPVAWASASQFHKHIVGFPKPYAEFFYWGMFGFVVLYIFFYQFWGPFELGQKITGGIFQFTTPANRFIANIIPFYLTVILLLYYVVLDFLEIKTFNHYFMFFSGFAFTMHILLVAQDLQDAEKAFIKPTYLMSIMFIVTLMICVTVLLYDFVLQEFTFPEFIKLVVNEAWDIYADAKGRVTFWK